MSRCLFGTTNSRGRGACPDRAACPPGRTGRRADSAAEGRCADGSAAAPAPRAAWTPAAAPWTPRRTMLKTERFVKRRGRTRDTRWKILKRETFRKRTLNNATLRKTISKMEHCVKQCWKTERITYHVEWRRNATHHVWKDAETKRHFKEHQNYEE